VVGKVLSGFIFFAKPNLGEKRYEQVKELMGTRGKKGVKTVTR
jgi:hypothetical protein